MTDYRSREKIISFICFFLTLNPYNRNTFGVGYAWTISNIEVHKVPLMDKYEMNEKCQHDDEKRAINAVSASPWCFAASSIVDLKPSDNFLATQVWPSARTAAMALQKYLDPKWTVCEFGCGPGLPSITAARMGACKVIATDLDELALKLVEAAASAQQLNSILQTSSFDLTTPIPNQQDGGHVDCTDNNLMPPQADLYILSDVFESSKVARGAAAWTKKLLDDGCQVWVFAQTDRAQREVYLDEIRQIHDSDCQWFTLEQFTTKHGLWLCEVDETTVSYG